MATDPNPIIFKITDAGKRAALDATGETPKVLINLTSVSIGSGRYNPSGKETALKKKISQTDLVSDSVEVVSNTLRFSTSMESKEITPVNEIGLFTDTGLLFAIASTTGDPLFTIHPNIVFVALFGITLGDLDAEDITVSVDPNGALSAALMKNHLAANNPHPQYLTDAHLDVSKDPHPQYVELKRFQLLLDVAFPIGYLHHTNSESNPKPEFDELLGITTAWRRLLGKIVVATDPDDPYINEAGITLGQKGMTTPAGIDRPNVYPLYTKSIFERYDPDTAVETVWNVESSKPSVNEGSSVRFTIKANNLPDGQILTWAIKEGALNDSENDITSPKKKTNGTVILKNGSATIDFTTSPDENIIEDQQHIRLTVGAPANLSINVPINDIGRNESVVNITRSTTSGIALDEYYKEQSGSYPLATDKIRFVISEFIDVIGPSADVPAIIDGNNWPAGSQIIIENHGRILGRGGNGGKAVMAYQYGSNAGSYKLNVEPAEKGSNGGTAIKGNIEVENYGLIAGGGGGGGGAGFFKASDFGYGHSGGAGGGAPLGKRYPNPRSYEEYAEILDIDNKYEIPPLKNPNGKTYDIYPTMSIGGKDHSTYNSFRGDIFSKGSSDLIRQGGVGYPVDDALLTFYIPDYVDSAKTEYRIWSWGQSVGWTNGFLQSTDATVDRAGTGGKHIYSSIGDTSFVNKLARIKNIDISKNKGGNGGGIGESGSASLLGEFYVTGDKVRGLTPYLVDKEDLELLSPPQTGGLAGYIKEGDVIIRNLADGTTKGR